MLERTHRYDGVERFVRLVATPAALVDLDVRGCDPAEILGLRIRKGKSHSMLHTPRADHVHDLRAPPAADVEHPLRPARTRLLDVIVEFAALRALQIVVGAFPHRTRVSHRGIEPDPPEFVADVVVVPDRGRTGSQVAVA